MRHNGRRPYRSPSSANTGVSEPFTSTAAMMQVSMTVRPTPSRSVAYARDQVVTA